MSYFSLVSLQNILNIFVEIFDWWLCALEFKVSICNKMGHFGHIGWSNIHISEITCDAYIDCCLRWIHNIIGRGKIQYLYSYGALCTGHHLWILNVILLLLYFRIMRIANFGHWHKLNHKFPPIIWRWKSFVSINQNSILFVFNSLFVSPNLKMKNECNRRGKSRRN